MWTEALILVAGVSGGAVAAVAGFGIGSLLTPAFALHVDTRLAVAAVSIPHVVGTAFRFWLLGARVDSRVLWSFGLTSAAGGLAGALLQARAGTPAVTVLFVLNRFKVARPAAYVLVGAILWICVLKSGVHATLAGVLNHYNQAPDAPIGKTDIKPLEFTPEQLDQLRLFLLTLDSPVNVSPEYLSPPKTEAARVKGGGTKRP